MSVAFFFCLATLPTLLVGLVEAVVCYRASGTVLTPLRTVGGCVSALCFVLWVVFVVAGV